MIQKGDAGLEIDKERYKRNILLPEVGEEGQKKLAESRVLVVGAGGLGSPASLYLAAAGVGTIGIADFDRVDVSNLQRQILYREQDIGKAKAELAAEQLQSRNHSVQVELYPEGITAENAEEILAKFDVIVDASDNFPTRYLLSDTCMKLGKPDVYGAICEFAGQVTVFASNGPCLRCLCPEAEDPSGNPNSAAYGVLGVIPGMIGCMQAAEVLKLLLGKGEALIGKMLFIDAKTWSTDLIEVPVHPQCSCHAHTKVHRT